MVRWKTGVDRYVGSLNANDLQANHECGADRHGSPYWDAKRLLAYYRGAQYSKYSVDNLLLYNIRREPLLYLP